VEVRAHAHGHAQQAGEPRRAPAYEVVEDVAQALAFMKEDFAKMQANKTKK
jgi:hypothetical protein